MHVYRDKVVGVFVLRTVRRFTGLGSAPFLGHCPAGARSWRSSDFDEQQLKWRHRSGFSCGVQAQGPQRGQRW
jgi:hypothetical protein